MFRFLPAIFLLASVPLLASEWDKKRFPNWGQQHVVRVLVDSPWGKSTRQDLNFERAGPQRLVTWKDLGVPGDGGDGVMNTGSPVGGIGKPKSKEKVEIDVNVRWSSALPVKQAAALTMYGKDGVGLPEAQAMLRPDPEFYVLEVSGIPAAMAFQGIEAMQAHLYENVRLLTGTNRSIPPAAVYVTSKGNGLNIAFRFSKKKPITVKDKELFFFMEYSILKVERKYKLKQMVYDGQLEL
jgi:hypothetical protein